ncbi:ankyrin repeat-containing domain protein, partial [Colletotrichum phormii]
PSTVSELLPSDTLLGRFQDEDRLTPLYWAASFGHAGVIRVLLARNGDADYANIAVNTLDPSRSPLPAAIEVGRNAAVEALLQDPRTSVAALGRSKWKLVHFAAHNEDIFQLLFADQHHGADITFRDIRGRTGLTSAARSNAFALVKTLIERGAAVNLKYVNGRTALSFAAQSAGPQVVALLLDAGAEPCLCDNEGKTLSCGIRNRFHGTRYVCLMIITCATSRATVVGGAMNVACPSTMSAIGL